VDVRPADLAAQPVNRDSDLPDPKTDNQLRKAIETAISKAG
jgi:hypothetical protein